MAAAAAAPLSPDGTAPARHADNLDATKCAATTSKLPARDATTATQPPLTVALPIAPLSAALFAMAQCPKVARQSAEMGSLLVTRFVTMVT